MEQLEALTYKIEAKRRAKNLERDEGQENRIFKLNYTEFAIYVQYGS